MELYNIYLFCAWYLSLSTMFSRSIHNVQHIKTSFLWQNNVPLYSYATFCLFIHLIMDTELFPPFGYYE